MSGVPPDSLQVVYRLSQTRNATRENNFVRSDVRVNKIFNTRHFNLTVHGEIENVTNHQNYVYYDFIYPAYIAKYPYVYATRDTTLPILPVAGFTFEF